MNKIAGVVCAFGTALSGAALGQFQEPTELVASPRLEEEKGWKAVLRRESPKKWEMTFLVQAVLVAGKEGGAESSQKNEFESTVIVRPDEGRDGGGREKLERLMVMLPWVPRTSTSRGMEVRAQTLELCGEEIDYERVWLDVGSGRPPQPGCLVTVPEDMSLNVDPEAGLMFEATVSYAVWSSQTKLDESQAKQAIWPDEWSEAFACELSDGVFLEKAVDPKTRRLREIDAEALTAIALEMAGVASIAGAKEIPPLTLIRNVAKATCTRLKSGGEAVIPRSQKIHGVTGKGGDRLTPMWNTLQRGDVFQGFNVAESLTVLRREQGNDAERATALAAVYRRLGVPARVVVAFDAAKPIPPTVILPLLEPGKPMPKTAPPLIQAPEYRFWVEVGLRHRDRGEAWIPIDPGSGGDSWRVGEVRDSDTLVPVSTSWWPGRTVVVGSMDTDTPGKFESAPKAIKIGPLPKPIKGRRIKGTGFPIRVRIMSGSKRDGPPPAMNIEIPIRAGAIGAGLWGFATEGVSTTCKWQSLGTSVKGGSVTTGERPPR